MKAARLPLIAFLLTCVGCAPSMTDRVAADVSAALAQGSFAIAVDGAPGPLSRYVTRSPAVRHDAMGLSYSVGRFLGLCVTGAVR